MTRIDKIKAAAQKVKQGRVKVYSKEEKKLFDSLISRCVPMLSLTRQTASASEQTKSTNRITSSRCRRWYEGIK